MTSRLPFGTGASNLDDTIGRGRQERRQKAERERLGNENCKPTVNRASGCDGFWHLVAVQLWAAIESAVGDEPAAPAVWLDGLQLTQCMAT
jgi:hypothetical protein